MDKGGFVYILASSRAGTLYSGVTSKFEQRIFQHRSGEMKGFTSRHEVKRLVWFERHDDIVEAIAREKRIKKWRRDWKLNLIEASNPHWYDLAIELGFDPLDTQRRGNGPPPTRG